MRQFIDHETPAWDDVSRDAVAVLPWLGVDAVQPTARIIRVRDQDRVLPALVMRCPTGKFRSPVDDRTEARILFDVVTALPFPTPFAYIFPVVFDDPDDPYWIPCFVHLFPITDPEAGWARAAHVGARRLVRMFCEEKPCCGLVIVDEGGTVLKSQMIAFDAAAAARFREIRDVIAFLDGRNAHRSLAECTLPQQVFERSFCATIEAPGGRTLIIPKGRSLRLARTTVFSIMVEHGRLVDRRAATSRGQEGPPEYDLFISHAHADTDVAVALSEWLMRLWPRLRIARTDPAREEAFRENPAYFITLARQSRCVLYLVTPNSIDRPMVETEIGCSADKPIVSVVLGGTTVDQLRSKVEGSLFLSLDLDLAVAPADAAGWAQVASLVDDALGVPRSSEGDAPDLPEVSPRAGDDAGASSAYFADWLAVGSHVYGIQDAEEADRAITEALLANGGEERARLAPVLESIPLELKLLTLLEARSEEAWGPSLECVPALLDEKLLGFLELRKKQATSKEESDRLSRMELVLVRAILDRKLTPLPVWSVCRGETFLEEIGVHPKALEYFDHARSNAREADFDFGFHEPKGEPPHESIGERVPEGMTGKDWFIGRLVQRIRDAVSSSAHSRALYCTTDFHSGRLANLLGSSWLEAKESNPWMGARGLVRYLQPAYAEVFNWELEACRRASNEGTTRIAVLFPLVRLPRELIAGIKQVIAAGMRPWGVGMIPEAPSNIFNLREFLCAGCTLGTGFRPILFIELAPLARAHQLGPVSTENEPGVRMLGQVLMTLVNEARSFEKTLASDLGVAFELGISHQDLTLLESVDPRLTAAIAGGISFLADQPRPDRSSA